MSLRITAPWPQAQTTILLPSPQFGDTSASSQSITLKRSMVGDTYTYVKTNARRKIRFQFELSRMKALELRAFILAYYRADLRIISDNGDVWHGIFSDNPFLIESTGGAEGWPGGEAGRVVLEFEATLADAGAHSPCT